MVKRIRLNMSFLRHKKRGIKTEATGSRIQPETRLSLPRIYHRSAISAE